MIYNVGSNSARTTSYDNTDSGLQATNVQGAVDELNNNLCTYFDDTTNTLYIQGGTSNYTYDSATQTLYIG